VKHVGSVPDCYSSKSCCILQHPLHPSPESLSPPPGVLPGGMTFPESGSSGTESEGQFIPEPDYQSPDSPEVSASSGHLN